MYVVNRSFLFRREISGEMGAKPDREIKQMVPAKRRLRFAAVCFALFSPALVSGQTLKSTYPRIGAYEIGGTHETVKPLYRQALAKHDIVILGMWRDWSGRDAETNEEMNMRDVVVDIKRRAAQMGNDAILVGKYTIFMESRPFTGNGDSPTERWYKLSSEVGPGYRTNNDWWARNSSGENTSSYPGNWNTNITEFVKRDSNGDTYPEWSVTHDYKVFFRDVPELDIWYIDNWFYRPRVKADWDGDGINDDRNSNTVKQYYRKGFLNGLRRARQLAPNRIFIGNVDGEPQIGQGMLGEPEYKSQISALYEGAIGKSYSQESWGSWETMMEQYQTTLQNARNRLLIMTVHGDATDYKLMRYGLASCLMDDGYYYYTTYETEYRSALWFDEFDVSLGRAIDPPQFKAWQKGIYRRRFENGVVLVNPKGNGSQTVDLEPGYRRISGKQDVAINNGRPVDSLFLEERDGIILLRSDAGQVPRPKPPVLSL